MIATTPNSAIRETNALPTIDQIINLELRIQEDVEGLREEIKSALLDIEDISPDKTIGQLSRGGTNELYIQALAAQSRREAKLALLEAALERMDDGDYGDCEVCTQGISWARLDAQPEALRCHHCA